MDGLVRIINLTNIKNRTMDTQKMIKAYCMQTKTKNVPMYDAVIRKTAKAYIAVGNDGKGHKMSVLMSEANALKAIADGVATKDF